MLWLEREIIGNTVCRLLLVQELENYLHTQKTQKQDELREVAQKLINSEVLIGAVSSQLSAYQLRCITLVTQVVVLFDCLLGCTFLLYL